MQACRAEYRSKKAYLKWEMELDNQWRSKNKKPLRFASVQPDPQDEEDVLPNGERAGEHDGPQLSEEWIPPKAPGKKSPGNAKNAGAQGELHTCTSCIGLPSYDARCTLDCKLGAGCPELQWPGNSGHWLITRITQMS